MKWKIIILLILIGTAIAEIDFMLLEGGNLENNIVRNPFTITSSNGIIGTTTSSTLPHPGHEGGGGGNISILYPILFVFTLIIFIDDDSPRKEIN